MSFQLFVASGLSTARPEPFHSPLTLSLSKYVVSGFRLCVKLRRTAVALAEAASQASRTSRAFKPLLGLVLLLFPTAAAAQSGGPSTSAQAGQGPMIVERVKSGFLVAPDFKVTRVDRRVSELAGAYAGWLHDQTFFIGGGGYWLANRSHDREMAYGGLVVGWLAGADRRIGFGAKGLVGGGRATLTGTYADFFDLHDERGEPTRLPVRIPDTRVRVRQDFLIAEPEANLLVNLSKHLRLTGGVGYRFIGSERGFERSARDRLRGATGSVALQIGGGS